MGDEIQQGRIVNHGTGEAGDAILALALATDMDIVAAWEGVGGEGGNCFFATVQMMHNLVLARSADGFEIVTGIFGHPDRATPVFHSWLEKGPIVLNVANLRRRPLYVAWRGDYYRQNFIERRIQRLAPARVARMVRTCDGDIREATKRLLKPTFAASIRRAL